MLLPLVSNAQVKIGNITVSDEIGKAYLLDCYNNPDTVYAGGQVGGLSSGNALGLWYSGYNVDFQWSIVSEIYTDKTFESYVDTIWSCDNGWIGFNGPYRCPHKIKHSYTTKIIPEETIRVPSGYYRVVRKPTETDFIKWLQKSKL